MNNIQQNIALLNNYYDKIYLVIIERNIPERLDKINESLKGLNFELFKGVDGRLISDVELNQIYDFEKSMFYMDKVSQFRYDKSDKNGLCVGNIGCSKSHLNIYKDMIQNDYKRILVLEDDARFNFGTINQIPEILKQMPLDTDLFYWGYRWYDCESILSRVKRKYLIPIKQLLSGKNVQKYISENRIKYPTKQTKQIWNAGYHAGTHAYAITQDTAKKIIQLNDPVIYAADMALAHLVKNKSVKAYIAVPKIFREDQSLTSSILYSEYKK